MKHNHSPVVFPASLAQPNLQTDHTCNQHSICLIYHSIFKRANSRRIRATRVAVWALTLLIVGYYVSAFFVSIFQCNSVSKSWHSKEKGTCIDLNKFRYYTAAANIITSVLIIVIPLLMRQTRPEFKEIMGLILLGLV